jgi:hypothetical protein
MKNSFLFLVILLIISCSEKSNKTKATSLNKKEEIIENLKKYQNSEQVVDILKITYQTIDSIDVKVDTMSYLSKKDKENYKKVRDVTIKDIETACNDVFLDLSDYERMKVLKTTEKSISDQKGMLEYLYRKLSRKNLKGWKQQKEK